VKKYISVRILPLFFVLLTLTSCALFRPASELPAFTDDTKANNPKSTDTIAAGTESSIPAVQTAEVTEAITSEDIPTESLPLEPERHVISFIGAGDNIVYYGNVRDAASCAEDGERKYNFAPTYSDVAPMIKEADIAFINQETLMCGEGYAFSYYPRFNGPQDLAYDLREAGFDVVNIANNHMLDKGADGLAATISFWNSMEDITLIGGYTNEADYAEPRLIRTGDITTAFLSYAFYTNGLTLPANSELVIPYPDDETVIAQLARARQLADYVIVSVHWGDENTFTPNDGQRSFAKLLSDHGADAIIGHHPHVIQPIEWLAREDGGRTLCVYSLGNFVAEMPRDYNMLGGLISFDIVKTGETVTTENVCFTPTVYYFTTSFYKNHVYLMTDFTEEMAASHGLAYYGRKLTVSALRKYLNNTIADEFLPQSLRSDA